MEHFRKKIFLDQQTKKLKILDIPKEPDYYDFLQGKLEKGLEQEIIFSHNMIAILKYYFINYQAKIVSIDLMMDDEELAETVNTLISQTTKDRGKFLVLIEKLDYFNSEKSIDIEKIRFKYRDKNNKIFDFTLLINGNILVNSDTDEQLSNFLNLYQSGKFNE